MTTPSTCPREYISRSDSELAEAIRAIKEKRGDSLTILGHHYQSDTIVGLSDYTGDSFKLCQDASEAKGRHIVFCGVTFMAESARVLARPDQIVQHPERTAGCPMADMADLTEVRQAWDILSDMPAGRRIIPVTYMNSNVDLKAFCGRHGGVVCTSSNAPHVFRWAYSRGDTILFFPDEHLGRNTADLVGLDPGKVALWDPSKAEAQTGDRHFVDASLIVWKGYCHVHTHFTLRDIRAARHEDSKTHIIVHPECPREVVQAADSSGSTETIVRLVENSQTGESITVGTELNLVKRLARRRPDLRVRPLSASVCPNMAKLSPGHLLWALENLGEAAVVEVDEDTAAHARVALERMLSLA